jgi:syntaxin 1B/2/3
MLISLQNDRALNPPSLTQYDSSYSQPSQYSQQAAHPEPLPSSSAPLSQQDFFARIDGIKGRINQLGFAIQEIASLHQRLLSSPDGHTSAQLESLVSDAQIRNGQIKDEIKFLERDAARDPSNAAKRTQVGTLKTSFRRQLDSFYAEESDYRKRYRDAVARQYRIVNPDATDQEVQQAADADWGEEGVFAQAVSQHATLSLHFLNTLPYKTATDVWKQLKSNRTGQASSVLGAVRARHNDIAQIEKTMNELSLLFRQLDEQVTYQQVQVEQNEEQTAQVLEDNKKANDQLDRGVVSARRARRLKWWTLLTFVAIVCILALILGLYFGLRNRDKNNNNNNNTGGNGNNPA